MKSARIASAFVAAALIVAVAGCESSDTTSTDASPVRYQLDDDSAGYLEKVNNIYNTSVVSNDPNVYKAEYEAGFIQGSLQKDQIPAARDNSWDSSYITDPSHTFPEQLPPSADDLARAQRTLAANWDFMLKYIGTKAEADVQENLRRLLYRLVGIYDGAAKGSPEDLPFNDAWLPKFSDAEMRLTYETPQITFMDLYLLNTIGDLFDFVGHGVPAPTVTPTSKCTAFVRKTRDDIFLTHNTWAAFLDQSQALQVWVNGDFMALNVMDPGYLGSGTDFGYNNKGLIFNETTEDSTKTRPKVKSIWTMWRETLAEQYADSIDKFFDYVTIEESGSYMNGYMIVDTNTNKLGYVELSYKSAVFFRPDAKGGVAVTTKPEGLNTAYDKSMVRPNYILGFNYPASHLIRKQLKAIDNRPARKVQLLDGIGDVNSIEAAKSLITYTAPGNPLSIYGRWDLGYGVTTTPQTVPDGSIDAKAVSASMLRPIFKLKGVLDPGSSPNAFWMKFGTASVDGKPFIWSESQWSGQKLRYVPDVVDGQWTLLRTNIR